MIEIGVKHTVDRLQAHFGNLLATRRTAVAIALTRTAQDVKRDEIAEMQRVFDRPTRWTLNALYMKPATAANLTARVWIKDSQVKYLSPQIHGGGRPWKRFEHLLHRQGYLPQGMAAVPGSGARMDSYGNMSRGQLVQVLSALKAFGEQGYMANRTRSARSLKSAKRAGDYFVGRPGGGKLPLGVWHKRGVTLKPVLIFVKAPQYRVRFKFYEVARRTVQREFHNHLVAALATRGPIR